MMTQNVRAALYGVGAVLLPASVLLPCIPAGRTALAAPIR